MRGATGRRRGWLLGWLLGSTRGRVLLLVLVAGLPAAVALPLAAVSRMSMGTRPVSEAELAAAGAGTPVDVALEVTGVPAGEPFTATLLERTGQGTYRRTGRTLRVRWRPDTPVTMGQRDDVRPGAVVQARGTLGAGDLLDAERLVILTGYATVR